MMKCIDIYLKNELYPAVKKNKQQLEMDNFKIIYLIINLLIIQVPTDAKIVCIINLLIFLNVNTVILPPLLGAMCETLISF